MVLAPFLFAMDMPASRTCRNLVYGPGAFDADLPESAPSLEQV